jgi:hypothetical protein
MISVGIYQLVTRSWQRSGADALALYLDELCQILRLYRIEHRVGHTLLV